MDSTFWMDGYNAAYLNQPCSPPAAVRGTNVFAQEYCAGYAEGARDRAAEGEYHEKLYREEIAHEAYLDSLEDGAA